MNDYKSMQKRMKDQGATMFQVHEAIVAEKNRYIAALEVRIDAQNVEIANLRAAYDSAFRQALENGAKYCEIRTDALSVAEWHLQDGDECGVIARRLYAALKEQQR